MEIYVASWECKDVETKSGDVRCEVIAHAKSVDGKSVCLRIPWTPFFYVEAPGRSQSDMAAKSFALALYESTRGLVRGKCRVVRKKSFVGFRNGKTTYFVQMVFESLAAWKRAKYNTKHTLYEAAMDPLIKFFHVSGTPAAGWTTARGCTPVEDATQRLTKPHVAEYRMASYKDLSPCDARATETPPLVICSWDIEAYSKSGHFPDSSKPSDKVITIGAVYSRFGSPEPYRRSVHVLGTCHGIDGVNVFRYDDEKDLIEGFMTETVREQTDFLLAWNSYGFDHMYLDGRATCLVDFQTGQSSIDMGLWSRTTDPESGKLVEKKLASSAYGDNTYYYHNTPGMISVDALQIFRKETKHDSYTLDNISKHYLDVSKIDLKPWEMFEKYKEEDPKGRTEIAEYCVRDCELPIKLVEKMNMLNGLIEFSKVTSIPIDWLLLRGQQIRVYSLIAKAARQKDFVIPDMHGGGDDGVGFTGAVVLDPKVGGYTEDIVCAMDFASLYPSIMMAHRMCGSTLVTDDTYGHLPGVDYYEVEAAPGLKVRFAQTEDNVIPGLLYELKALRKQAKRDMASATDDFTRGLLNSRQLAYKLVMNSLYGALGSNHGLLCGLKKISMSVTATGRWMIHETKRLVETMNPGSRVVYGDSVAAYTPIYVRRRGTDTVTTFDALATELTWHACRDGKEVADGQDIETWSDIGWTRVERVIRHQHDGHLIRVNTHTGVVDVTEHHSLLDEEGRMVKSGDVNPGDTLLHAPLPPIVTTSFDGKMIYATQLDAAVAIASLYPEAIAIDCLPDGRYRLERGVGQNASAVKAISPVPYSGYVYDFSTTNHHFSAGPGLLVVHNTDSVLCILNCGDDKRQDLHTHFQKATEMAEQISKRFLPPHELEMEKAYFPYLLVTKKRYAGLMYETPDGTPKIDIKGLQLVRRDSPKLVKRISQGMLEKLLYDRSFDLAMTYVRTQILAMLRGQVDVDEYIMSKSLRSNYKNQNLPHLIVAKKRQQRGGTPFRSGERVPFIYVQADMDLGVSQRAEDAEYAKEHALPIDTLYYIKNQLLTPLVTLLQLKYPNAESEILNDKEIADRMVALQAQTTRLVRESKRIRTNTTNKQREITSFFKKDP